MRRALDVDGTWRWFTEEMDSAFLGGMRPLPNESTDFLAEAIRASKGEAYDAAALACRAAIETAGWQSLYLERVAYTTSWVSTAMPRKPNGEPYWLRLDDILEGLGHFRILGGEFLAKAGTVKARGEMVAHLVQKYERTLESHARKWVKNPRPIKGIPPWANIKTRVSAKEGARLIQLTAEVLLELHRQVPKRTGPTRFVRWPEASLAD